MVAAEIDQLELDRRAAEERLSVARTRLQRARDPRRMLVERGKETLEPLVRDALRELGGDVKEATSDGIEDGTLSWGARQAVLEIKGRTGAIKQDDVRQVVQRAVDARLRYGVEYKPIIVGNPHCDVAPDRRGETLAPNAATYAANGGVAVITTIELFEALRRHQLGTFDPGRFWEAVFDARGATAL